MFFFENKPYLYFFFQIFDFFLSFIFLFLLLLKFFFMAAGSYQYGARTRGPMNQVMWQHRTTICKITLCGHFPNRQSNRHSSQLVYSTSGVQNSAAVHHTLDEDGVVLDVASAFETLVCDEPWAAAGNVHVRFRFLERAAHRIGLECVDNVSARTLVDESERDSLGERPGEDIIKLSLHYHKEERHVWAFTDAVPHYVQTQAHLVPVAAGVKGERENGGVLSGFCVGHSLAELRDFPDHRSIVVAVLDEREAKISILDLGVLRLDRFLQLRCLMLESLDLAVPQLDLPQVLPPHLLTQFPHFLADSLGNNTHESVSVRSKSKCLEISGSVFGNEAQWFETATAVFRSRPISLNVSVSQRLVPTVHCGVSSLGRGTLW